MRALLAALVVIVLVASACGSSEAPDTEEVVGVVIRIESGSGFGDVESFTVKQGDQDLEIFVDPDITYEFPLAHLNSDPRGSRARAGRS